ncbi:uracil-DNA glycosylase [Stappia sp. F7233]|uniref:Type-4 uracil-DNA glycosylase n=1 Tax=Stappia albiluteola TaxID=2758565 RepID=A0A839AHM8_9HYPH|nr:uracil-DNA glycosylase [Stappia albiluteola]MBA5778434.1 uracil-DNA glycosylase [Stappia albiluteola]
MSTSGPIETGHKPSPGEADRLSLALEALLDFYAASGVDGLVDADPFDAFSQTLQPATQSRRPEQAAAPAHPGPARREMPRPQQPATPQQPAPARAQPGATAPRPPAQQTPAAVIPGEEAVDAARAAARSAASLDALHKALASFDGCNLSRTAKNLVFADGNPESRVMFVGEAPGRDEDLQGLPFVGRSGQLLDRMLAAIGLDRSSVYIANVVPWRPPGNRTPSPQETEICKPFIARQIELVDPDILVFLGGASAKALTGVTDGILRLRGRWMPYRTATREIRAIATLHPAYLLRSPIQKRLAWRDFLAIGAALKEGENA